MGRRAGKIALAALVACAAAVSLGAHSPVADAHRLLTEAAAEARRGNLDAAFTLANTAAQLDPKNPDAQAVREILRQRATLVHLERAHDWERGGDRFKAAVEYRAALDLAPGNADALQGLALALAPPALRAPTPDLDLRVAQAAAPINLEADRGAHDLHLHGPVDTVLGGIAATYGLSALVADSLAKVSVSFDLDDATFSQAMRLLAVQMHIGYVPVNPHTLYFGDAKVLDAVLPLAERTFYLPELRDASTLGEVASAIRGTLGVNAIFPDQSNFSITMRARPEVLDAAERMLLDLDRPQNEVLLEVRIVEIDGADARNLGLDIPNQFNVFTLGPLLEQLSQNASQEQNILNLFESGGLNAVLNSGQLNASELQQVQSTLSPLLQNPFVTFGGGASLMALSIPSPSLNLSQTDSETRTLERAVLRSSQNVPVDLKIGERYPIVNAVFSPISLSPAISSVIGNLSYTQPFPSFTYEDLGVEVKLTPRTVNQRHDVSLGVQINVKGLTGQSNNGLPILTNRVLNSQFDVRDGEPLLMAGMLDREETVSLTGIAGLANLPGLGALFSTRTGNLTDEQLLLIVTPHIVREHAGDTGLVWLPPGFSPPEVANAAPAFFPGLTPAAPGLPGPPPAPGQPGGPPLNPNGIPVPPPAPLTAPVQPGGRGGGE